MAVDVPPSPPPPQAASIAASKDAEIPADNLADNLADPPNSHRNFRISFEHMSGSPLGAGQPGYWAILCQFGSRRDAVTIVTITPIGTGCAEPALQ
jgi:hypothetical protein